MTDSEHAPSASASLVQGLVSPDDAHNRNLVSRVRPPLWSNPAPPDRYDLVVVGAGTAGLVSAAGAAGLGARVALVERHFMGGDCLNFGCVPSKAVLRAARAWHAVGAGGAFGAPTTNGAGNFGRVMERMRALRSEIAENDSAERFRRLGVDVFFGSARFVGKDRLRVDGTELRFRKATIATGARAAIPPIPGLASSSFLTNESVFELETLPTRLAVLGAGPIGCELAQAFARFGSKVVLLDRDSRILPRDDADAASVLLESLERDGVHFIGNAQISNVERRDAAIVIAYAHDGNTEEIAFDALLVATGRAPNVEGLDLEQAGVAYDDKGISVDRHLRTTNRRVFACGDVTGGFQFTHAADAAARTVIRNALFLGRARTDRSVIPWCTYSDPEVAHVGIDSTAASRASDVETITVPYAELDRARLDGADRGFLRIHVGRRRGRIVGATAVGERAGETIGQISLAMTAGLGLGAIAETVYPYPTYAEAIKKAADAWRRGKLTPFSRRILNLIRYFGVRF